MIKPIIKKPLFRIKQKTFKSQVEKIVKERKKKVIKEQKSKNKTKTNNKTLNEKDSTSVVYLREPPLKKKRNMTVVSEDVTHTFRARANIAKIEQAKRNIKNDVNKRFKNSTLIEIKNNLRDPLAKDIPNSLPRRSSLLGIVNTYKRSGLTNFALAVTDVKTGNLMGYTVIKITKEAKKFIDAEFGKIDLDTDRGRNKFRTYTERLISTEKGTEKRYETLLKEGLGLNIKRLTMPGYTIDPETRDFRVKTVKEKLKLKNK